MPLPPSTEPEPGAVAFDNAYVDWKGWDWANFDELPESKKRYFRGEIGRLGLSPGARILEVGFGRGEFLEWARHSGFEVAGIEVIEGLVDQAKQAGFAAERLDPVTQDWSKLADISSQDGFFDAIVAFDVIEHMSADELRRFLHFAGAVLVDQGKILARFPNCGSLIGLRFQNGDQTHKLALTESKLRQLTAGTGFDVVFCDNAFRVTGNHWFSRAAAVTFAIRYLAEWLVGTIHLIGRIPLDGTLTAVMERRAERDSTSAKALCRSTVGR